MFSSSRWSGWVAFAAIVMIVLGALDVLEGVIAVVRQHYYVLTANQIIVFDVRTWGWVTLAWGAVIILAGLALLSRATWARWFAIVLASLNIVEQLGFLGSAQFPLWTLTVIAFSGVVLYALIVHWDEVEATTA
jgi:hypothetical protein